MNLLFVSALFNERITQALCWTLVHSLWQGLLLAILAGIVILLTRKSAPVIRYGLFSALFLLFLGGSCFTFMRQWHHAAAAAGEATRIRVQDQPSAEKFAGNEAGLIGLPAQPGYLDRLGNYFNEHAWFIVALWLIIFSARMVRMMAQLGTVQRLKHYRVHAPSAFWKRRLKELADLLGIRTPVTLLESEIVKAPMMSGMIKPVILLPFSLLSQLPPAQVEAILLHELAHIRRRDYFVNLLFSFSEMVFFFNPGVLWICTLIREERENCCDDIAIREAGNKKEFISALVSFQQYDRKAAISAIAFPGSGSHLLQRVRRIIYQDDKTLDGREKFFLLFCFLISGVLMLAFTRSSPMGSSLRHSISYHKSVPAPRIGHSVKDTLPGDSSEVQDRAMEATHDERSVRDSVAAVAAKAEQKAKVKAEKEQQKMEEKEQKEKAEMDKDKVKAEIKEQKEMEHKQRDEQKERKEIERKERDEQKELMEIKERQEKEEMDQEKGGMKERKEKVEKAEQKEKIEAREQKEIAEADERLEQIEKSKGQIRISENEKKLDEQLDRLRSEEKRLSEEDIRLTEATRQIQMEKKRMAEQYLLADSSFHGKRGSFERGKRKAEAATDRMEASRRDHQILSSIVGDLIRKHLIDNKDEFSFVLKDDGFIVNGVRQPDELLKQFRKKYLGDPSDFVLFSKKKDGSESSSIHIHSISI